MCLYQAKERMFTVFDYHKGKQMQRNEVMCMEGGKEGQERQLWKDEG